MELGETRMTQRRYIIGIEVMTTDGPKKHAQTFETINDEQDVVEQLRQWAEQQIKVNENDSQLLTASNS